MPESKAGRPTLLFPISLIGLMGAGKSVIGKSIAALSQSEFFDSDSEIEKKAGISIQEIFKKQGEASFRQFEQEVISELIELKKVPYVLSTGGGAFVQEKTRQLLLNKTKVVWLKASSDTLLARVSHSKHRPLLNGPDKKSIIDQLIDERYPIYQDAHIIVSTDALTRNQAVNSLIRELTIQGCVRNI